jgi:hypothetical protein
MAWQTDRAEKIIRVLAFSKLWNIKNTLWRNVLKKNLNVHGGFTPATLASPPIGNPEKVITALSHCAGAVREDRHCSFLKSICPFYFDL